jgi:hypothetical protein
MKASSSLSNAASCFFRHLTICTIPRRTTLRECCDYRPLLSSPKADVAATRGPSTSASRRQASYAARLDRFREVRQDIGVDLVGLRQPACCAGELAHLARVHDHYWQLLCQQPLNQLELITAGGFKQDTLRRGPLRHLYQSCDPPRCIRRRKALAAGPEGHVQSSL